MRLRLPSKSKKRPSFSKPKPSAPSKPKRSKSTNGKPRIKSQAKLKAAIDTLDGLKEEVDEKSTELETAKDAYSDHLESMLEQFGKGPHKISGGNHVIVCRGGGYFLRKVKD